MMYLAVTTLIAGAQFVLERRVSPDVERGRRPLGESALGRFFGFRLQRGSAAVEAVPPRPQTVASDGGVAAGAGRVDLVDLVGAQAARTSSEDGGPFVRCADVWKAYGHRGVLLGIDLTVHRGDVVTLMGVSGAPSSWRAWGSPIMRTTCRHASRAASSSAWRSPGRWPSRPGSCSSMSPPRRWIPSWCPRSSA